MYASEMSDSNNSAFDVDLKLLAKRLVREGMPVQSVVAHEAKVSQSTVSRAIHGRIKTSSEGAKRLWSYVESRATLLNATGSTPSKSEQKKSPRKRAARIPRRKSESEEKEPYDRERLAQEAMDGLKDYLDDAFDPQLVIEQLSMLRRAQDSQRA